MNNCDQKAYEAANPELTDDDILGDMKAEITLDELCNALATRPGSFGALAFSAGNSDYQKRLIGAAVLRVLRDLAEERLAQMREAERSSWARAKAACEEITYA